MPSLRELQIRFAETLFSDEPLGAGFLAWCAGPHAEAGVAAYRRGVRANLSGAVRASYPVVGRIVGDGFFEVAIRRYVAGHASTCGDLNAYGHDFGDFLAGFEPAAGLPYLPDVARMEWHVQEVYGLADAPAQDLSLLAEVGPERWGDLRFGLDPAHVVFASDWPLARLWHVNQPGYAGDFSVDFDAAQTVLIHRRPVGTAVEALTQGEAALLTTLSAGAAFEAAVARAAADPGFVLPSALQRFIGNGLLRRAFLP